MIIKSKKELSVKEKNDLYVNEYLPLHEEIKLLEKKLDKISKKLKSGLIGTTQFESFKVLFNQRLNTDYKTFLSDSKLIVPKQYLSTTSYTKIIKTV